MSSFFLEDVRIFDGKTLLPGRCNVQVQDGIIASIEHSSERRTPLQEPLADQPRIPGNGMMLLPGFIDAHVHVYFHFESLAQATRFGVTTVFDLFNEPERAIWMKQKTSKSASHPQVYSAHHGATVDEGWPRQPMRRHTTDREWLAKLDTWPKLDSEESIKAFVVSHKAEGADIIKLMQESGEGLNMDEVLPAPSLQMQSLLVREAHTHGLLTVAHATNLRETLLVLRAGVDGLAHQFFDQPHSDELLREYKERGAFVIPTLVAVNSFNGTGSAERFLHDKPLLQVQERLEASTRECLCSHMKFANASCDVRYAYDCVARLKREGVDIVCGTDSGVGHQATALGLSLHHEMSMYVEHCSMTPSEALASATSTSSRRLNLTDRGVIEIGKRADLVLVDGDPTTNIQDALKIRKVWKKGELAFCS